MKKLNKQKWEIRKNKANSQKRNQHKKNHQTTSKTEIQHSTEFVANETAKKKKLIITITLIKKLGIIDNFGRGA